MRPSPAAVFVGLTLALGGGIAFFATPKAGADTDGNPELPTDTATFGFITRARAGGVPVLEATKPFRIELANGPVHGQPPSPEHLRFVTRLLDRELGRYPQGFFKKAKLAGIVLTDDLQEGDRTIPSLPNVGGLLLLDTTSVESDLVRSLHHEVYHFVDLADDGTLAPDPAWAKIAGGSLQYGSGGRTMQSAWAAAPAGTLPGFVSAYATSGVEEDKAETFSFVVARRSIVEPRLPEDPVLAEKVDELRRRLDKLVPGSGDQLIPRSPPDGG